ncbi:endonuclease domain-containing 1 protein-like isoform 2-T2 [Menidia menidia]
MSAPKVWRFFPMATLLLLFCIGALLGEVVQSISHCNHFFLRQTPPHIPGILEGGRICNQERYKLICQTYIDKSRFLTLYDIHKKIPVFSAFMYIGGKQGGRPKTHWMIEPQLEDEKANKNMMDREKGRTYNHQAIETDFTSIRKFDKGHIFPNSYAYSKDDKVATFTLTNVVPQAKSFNQGSWSKMETCVKCVMEKYCINSRGRNEGYVVAGAQPSSNNVLNKRVNIPSLLWSAFCCYSAKTKMWIASAHWGENVPDESKDKHLETRTLRELYSKLTDNPNFKVFPKQCPLNTNVNKFYPKVKKCQCPSFHHLHIPI